MPVASVVETGAARAFYQWYSAARYWVGGSSKAALANALWLWRLERTLHLPSEAALQAAVLVHPAVTQFLALYYGVAHFAWPAVALVVLYRHNRGRYRWFRRAFVWMSAAAVVLFALWPVMPPRLLPPAFGFVDVLASRAHPPPVAGALAPALYNGFAAMPSLHAAYAVWTVVALWPAMRTTWPRAALVGHIALTSAAVVVTGNHYILDVVAGAAVALVAVRVSARPLARTFAIDAAVGAAAAFAAAAAVVWAPKHALTMVAFDLVFAVGLLHVVARKRRRTALAVPL